MTQFIIGAILGAGVGIYITGARRNNMARSQSGDYEKSVEKLKSQNRDLEHEIDRLQQEIKRLNRKVSGNLDMSDDLREDLESAQRKIKNLKTENQKLVNQLQEYKMLCASYEDRLSK